MSLLFAENGVSVSLNDPSEDTVNALIAQAKKEGIDSRLEKHLDYKELYESLDSPRCFVFSLPHGTVGDTVLDGLQPYLTRGDVIIDASNENWPNTQRRQGKCVAQGVYYVGMGVSGGYQAARRGPSMCPGGEPHALDLVLPLLEKVCARDSKGRACVGRVGTGGAGHYVKMIHNGIEHSMMSSVAEAWQIMTEGLGMSYEDISKEFTRWNDDGELKNTFLVGISAKICQTKDEHGKYVLSYVQDKVVQDTDETEGTGIWSNLEAIRLHIPAPSLATSHSFRLASADRKQRLRVKETVGSFPPQRLDVDRKEFLEDLRIAVYEACLAAYVQGINIIDKADRENRWGIDFAVVTQIWRAGCIIQADHIADMMEDIYAKAGHGKDADRNLLYNATVASELKRFYQPLKRVVLKATEADSVIPSLSASLEYLKYSGNTERKLLTSAS